MKHRFEKGQSGNPAGRPRGRADSRNRYREMLQPHIPEVLDKLVELAKDGDVAAAKLVLERTVPAARAKDIPTSLPLAGATVAERGMSVIDASIAGTIAPAEAEIAMALLQGQTRIIETSELLARIESLEARYEAREK